MRTFLQKPQSVSRTIQPKTRASRLPLIQRMAWSVTRPLGQQPMQGPLMPGIGLGQNQKHDANLGFGNLKINHRHIIFNDHQLLPTGLRDNIGFHCLNGTVYGQGGLFSEEWQRLGYTGRVIISRSADEDLRLVNAIDAHDPPGNYNLITHNCQDWVDEVRATAGL